MRKNLTTKKITHNLMPLFESQNHVLLVNGIALPQIKLQVGQTPFYVYDRSIIEKKINLIRKQLPQKLKLHYAVKANPMQALVDYIAPLTDGLDVASASELIVARNSGINTQQISFAGPGKNPHELSMAIASGVTLNVESFNELQRIKNISQQLAITARVALRVNPNFELKSSGMKMSGGAQQFGIDEEAIPEALRLIKDYQLHYRGLHIFTGSQNLNAESIMQAHQHIFQLAERLQQQTDLPIELLNIGGGFGIPYFPGEKPLQLSTIGENLHHLMQSFNQSYADAEIAIELGRYIVGECGLYVCEVIDIKQSRGKVFIITNGGLHHHLAASGNFGQVIRKNYPLAIANKIDCPAVKAVQIVGPLCTPLDLLANEFALPQIEIGDLLVIYQSGAYGYTASPKDFLSHPQPLQVLI